MRFIKTSVRATFNYVSKRLLAALALILVRSTYTEQLVRGKAAPFISVHVQTSRRICLLCTFVHSVGFPIHVLIFLQQC